jgi:transposase
MNTCKDCGQERDDYHFTNDEDICDYCWAMRGGN